MPHTIVWFRQDLRLSDNPALNAALQSGADIIPVYILDDENAGEWPMGAASRFWLHHSLAALDKSLDGNLVLLKGKAEIVLEKLIRETKSESIFWNRCYDPWRMERDAKIKQDLKDHDIEVQSFNASLLWEPHTVTKNDGTPYKVFTPYYRKGCLSRHEPREPLKAPKDIKYGAAKSLKLSDLNLLPAKPRWDKKMEAYWHIGEAGAAKQLKKFLDGKLHKYKEGRNFPAESYSSLLSPHLHFGEISPHQVWHASKSYALMHGEENNLDNFHSELGWREFSYYLLYHFHDLPEKPWNPKFARMGWSTSAKNLKAWQVGNTGYPIVDAGMRELWETGYMHNRVRMVTASFLIKHLRINWVTGEKWFWDCLVDADLANNAASWQWVAGCGADASPYYRIFNPVLQGEKFDAAGAYVRKWVPELKNLPDKYIHAPWTAPDDILRKAGVDPGKTYPHPIVEHNTARQAAMEAYKEIK